MTARAPRCRRCDGTRFFHVTHMRDASVRREPAQSTVMRWETRPVCLADGPAGYFDTLVCRDCGYTEWFARSWQSDDVSGTPAPCRECGDVTPHARLDAIEHAGAGYDRARLTHDMWGREGFLQVTICEPCGHVEWHALDYEHLEQRRFVGYRLTDDKERACLRCGQSAAIVDDQAQGESEVPLPVAPKELGVVARMLAAPPIAGEFQLRVCRPCGSVEWYGRKLGQLQVTEHGDVQLVDGSPQMAVAGGPYR